MGVIHLCLVAVGDRTTSGIAVRYHDRSLDIEGKSIHEG